MGPIDRTTWYWSPERLQWLVEFMKQIANCEAGQWYFGPNGLVGAVLRLLWRHGHSVLQRNVEEAIRMLQFFGVVEPGVGGAKPANYRRLFYPHKAAAITWDGIQRWRETRNGEGGLS